MSARSLLAAVIYICLCTPAISTFIIHPKKHFGVPPGKVIMPGKLMKFPGKLIPMPRPGPFLMRPHLKPFMFVKKGPVHPFLLHTMKKMKKVRMFVLPPNQRLRPKFGKLRRGPIPGKSIRPPVYSRKFLSLIQKQSKGGRYDKNGRLSPARKGGYSGRRPMKFYGNKQQGGISGMLTGGQPRGVPQRQGFSRGGFLGGPTVSNFQTLADQDIFDDQFDDRFDSGFEMDVRDDRSNRDIGQSGDKRNDDVFDRQFEIDDRGLGHDRDPRDSLLVPGILNTNSGDGRHFNMDIKQVPYSRNEFDDKNYDQLTSHGGFGLEGDTFGSMQPGHMPQGDSGFNLFNVQPGFLEGHTGVNAGGGIGLLQNNDRAEDRFDDKARTVSVDISVNAMDPFTQNMGSFGGMAQVPQVPQKHEGMVETGTAGFPVAGSQIGLQGHGAPHTGDAHNKDFGSGLQHDDTSRNNAIDGLELLGNSHPNMMANRFLNVETESDLQRTHPSNLQVLPYNPHSDETVDGKGPSSSNGFDEGSLSLLGIDPRTIQSGLSGDQFGMHQSGTGAATQPAQFPMHQPAQFPQGTQLNMNNHGALPETFPDTQFSQDAWNQQPGMQHDMYMPFPPPIQTHPQSSMGHSFTPDNQNGAIESQTYPDFQMDAPTDIQFHSQLSLGQTTTTDDHKGALDSKAFQNIQMNAELFQDFGLLDSTQMENLDHSAHGDVGQVPSLEQLQFVGDSTNAKDMSILAQFPSVDDLNFGMDNFKTNEYESVRS